MPILSPGDRAPEFQLRGIVPGRAAEGPGVPVRLSDLRGHPVVLVFYPFDFSPTCTDQLAVYNELPEVFADYEAQVVAISVDSVWCHAAFARARRIGFTLLSDFEPKGAVARRYGAYSERLGACERALFVLDAAGVIRWSHLSAPGVNPGADGILAALEAIAPRPAGRAPGHGG